MNNDIGNKMIEVLQSNNKILEDIYEKLREYENNLINLEKKKLEFQIPKIDINSEVSSFVEASIEFEEWKKQYFNGRMSIFDIKLYFQYMIRSFEVMVKSFLPKIPDRIARGNGFLSNAGNYVKHYLKVMANKFVNGLFYLLKHPKFMLVIAQCFKFIDFKCV